MLRRPFVFTAVLIVGWLGFTAWCDIAGAHKLAAGGLAGVDRPAGVVVTLAFEPEEFHMNRLQQAGRLVGVEHRTIRLADVPPGEVISLAREYWVTAIRRDAAQ